MQAETSAKIDTIKSALGLLRKHVKYDEAKARLVDLEVIIANGDFWHDQENAQNMMREKNRIERQLAVIDTLQLEMSDLVALLELGAAENDEEIVADAEASLSKPSLPKPLQIKRLHRKFKRQALNKACRLTKEMRMITKSRRRPRWRTSTQARRPRWWTPTPACPGPALRRSRVPYTRT